MDPMLVISPHFDDAVLSVGQVLAGRPDAIVATLFTARPAPRTPVSTYDVNCGFRTGREAMTARVREDRAAMALLAARSVHLGCLDHQYRGDGPVDEQAAAEALAQVVAEEAITTVVGPLGIGHVDHVIAARVYARLLDLVDGLVDPWLYEDLPSRVLWPEQVPARLGEWHAAGWRTSMLSEFLGTGPLDVKEAALDCYRSQLWALDPHVVRCPERVWKMHRVDDPGGRTDG